MKHEHTWRNDWIDSGFYHQSCACGNAYRYYPATGPVNADTAELVPPETWRVTPGGVGETAVRIDINTESSNA